MPHDLSSELYAFCQAEWARPVTFTTLGINGRGIYNPEKLDVVGEDGSLTSAGRTILDILDAEYAVLPRQGDRLTIPANGVGAPAEGDFEVIDTYPNGGGETTLVLRKIQTAT